MPATGSLFPLAHSSKQVAPWFLGSAIRRDGKKTNLAGPWRPLGSAHTSDPFSPPAPSRACLEANIRVQQQPRVARRAAAPPHPGLSETLLLQNLGLPGRCVCGADSEEPGGEAVLPAYTKGKDPRLLAWVEAGTPRPGMSALMKGGNRARKHIRDRQLSPESVHGRRPAPQAGSGSLFHSVSHGVYIHEACQLGFLLKMYIFILFPKHNIHIIVRITSSSEIICMHCSIFHKGLKHPCMYHGF